MNDRERIDLSVLDPARDAERWSGFVAATNARVGAALRRRSSDPLLLIADWSRPLLIAAGVALAVLIPAELFLELRESGREQIERLVTLSAGVGPGNAPTGTAFLRALAEEGLP